ncbi:hypothetical protein G6F31_017726 [Rhizopus arrhizus]|nr:hypothetical protein G6F31_017726 [Rhizopus arrhizus]
MADEQVRQVQFFAQVHEKIQDLRLDRHVQRGHGFVADQHGRLHGQRAGDADALALPARDLVREAVAVFGVQAHFLQGLVDAAGNLGGRGQLVDLERFAQDLAQALTRVQGCLRVLEDHLHA